MKTRIKEKTIEQIFEELNITTGDNHVLIIWNDDHNDILHVIKSLVEICYVDPSEAYNMALEAHTKGKAIVKKDVQNILLKMKESLNKKGLEATVEKE